MTMNTHSLEEQAVASVVAMLGSKRGRDEESVDAADAAGGREPTLSTNPAKIARVSDLTVSPTPITMPVAQQASNHVTAPPVLRPAPYFYYRDFSEVSDPDPLTPLTPPGRVPNFPAKMHAILSRSDLADIVAWMPHGRSWRVLKPREFEIRVIPTYFEHSKFSSFIRQANGWGFRRITQGPDRNSYYHELFLRGLPHLCKQLKRPGVNEKLAADVDHEPDFYEISKENPVPEKADDDSIMLHCTVKGGPKARMPVYCTGGTQVDTALNGGVYSNGTTIGTSSSQEQALLALHQALVAQRQLQSSNQHAQQQQPQQQQPTNPANALLLQNVFAAPSSAPSPPTAVFPATTFASQQQQHQQQTVAAAQAAASQFAAGFAAATALSSNHLRNVLGQALVAASPQQFSQQQQQQLQQQAVATAYAQQQHQQQAHVPQQPHS